MRPRRGRGPGSGFPGPCESSGPKGPGAAGSAALELREKSGQTAMRGLGVSVAAAVGGAEALGTVPGRQGAKQGTQGRREQDREGRGGPDGSGGRGREDRLAHKGRVDQRSLGQSVDGWAQGSCRGSLPARSLSSASHRPRRCVSCSPAAPQPSRKHAGRCAQRPLLNERLSLCLRP